MTLRAKQSLAVVLGFVVATVMVVLGVWQMGRFQLSVADVAQQRAQLPPVELAPAVHADGSIDDVFGRRVRAEGEFLPGYQSVVGSGEPRVVTALRLSDGRHVAVVRGQVAPGAHAVAPPVGPQLVAGIFSASDHEADRPQGSVRLQQLAQEWPSPLISGYITLDEEQSRAHGLLPARVELPKQEGTYMHQGYALQWWVFAAASVAFGIFTARQFKVQEEMRAERLRRREEKMRTVGGDGEGLVE